MSGIVQSAGAFAIVVSACKSSATAINLLYLCFLLESAYRSYRSIEQG